MIASSRRPPPALTLGAHSSWSRQPAVAGMHFEHRAVRTQSVQQTLFGKELHHSLQPRTICWTPAQHSDAGSQALVLLIKGSTQPMLASMF